MHGRFVPPPVCVCPMFITGSDIDMSVNMTERTGGSSPVPWVGMLRVSWFFWLLVFSVLITDTLLIALCSLLMSPQTRTVP